jgi:regulator of sigma E protease
MLDLLFYTVAFLVLIGVLVVVHEWGHFVVARWCGVKVLRFSIGFGRVLWRRRLGSDQTEFTLCALPLGGYVRMLDEREMAEGETIAPVDLPHAYNRQSLGKRSAIVAAGPVMNLFLAFVIYALIYMAGSEEPSPLLGEPLAGSAAAVAGIQRGDLVREVAGEAVLTLEDFHWRLLQEASRADSVVLALTGAMGTGDRQVTLPVSALKASGWEGNPFERLGLRLFRPPMPPVVGEVMADSPAAKSGLLAGDRILAVNDAPLADWSDFVTLIRDSAGKPLFIDVLRAGEQRAYRLMIAPETRDGVWRIGVSVDKVLVERAVSGIGQARLYVTARYSVFAAIWKAARATWDKSAFTLIMVGRMLTGEVSWKNLSGPILIADYAGKSARMGLDAYLKFIALVSISLGLLNLLPIPVLDGGHLMYHALEFVRGRPVSEHFIARGQQIGMSLLLALMLFAFFNDVTRLFHGS